LKNELNVGEGDTIFFVAKLFKNLAEAELKLA
jgi:hypothetical protein